MTLCSIEGCQRTIHNKTHGWCQMHYHRWYRTGDPLSTRQVRHPCRVDGCAEPISHFGMCRDHAAANPVPSGKRRCNHCLTVKDPSDFSSSSSHKDGIDGRCRACRNYIQNKRNALNPERHRAHQRKWREKNPTKPAEDHRKFLAANPFYDRDLQARRRAQKRGTEVEPIESRVVLERDRWTCGICGGPIDPTLRAPDGLSASVDHMVALARGGTHTYDNVQAAHLRCNIRKGARTDLSA